MVKMSAGKWVVEVLRSQGVRYVYGVVGSAFLEIMDAMYGLEDIEFVGTRHEQGAGFMALGYAHATGKPGVCLVTNGPGATNLVTPVAGAHVTHAPMVAMIGGISTGAHGSGVVSGGGPRGGVSSGGQGVGDDAKRRADTGYAAACVSGGHVGEDGTGGGGHSAGYSERDGD